MIWGKLLYKVVMETRRSVGVLGPHETQREIQAYGPSSPAQEAQRHVHPPLLHAFFPVRAAVPSAASGRSCGCHTVDDA